MYYKYVINFIALVCYLMSINGCGRYGELYLSEEAIEEDKKAKRREERVDAIRKRYDYQNDSTTDNKAKKKQEESSFDNGANKN